ncbi:unnamed protein product [Rotaria sp. Silwood2]|nr:unnamed protein product [Rotaria sp. Silwood2]CAF4880947.1 unnamed protein product [Rotaria sp. Silwood2]
MGHNRSFRLKRLNAFFSILVCLARQRKRKVKTRRLNCFQVFSQRFLPPPVPFAWGSSGLVIAANDSKQDRFCGSLFQRLQLSKLIHKALNSSSISFDYFCTSVKQSILKRTCKICNKYFLSMERRKKPLQNT